jgi:hypothetical protein
MSNTPPTPSEFELPLEVTPPSRPPRPFTEPPEVVFEAVNGEFGIQEDQPQFVVDSELEATPPVAASTMDSPDEELPAPLQGCLFCHSEKTISSGERKTLFGLGRPQQTLTCSSCGAVALFQSQSPDQWRIQYVKVPHVARYYYLRVHLAEVGWLDSDQALEISQRGYVQRHRMQQIQRGDLAWLHPHRLTPPPPLMSPAESVYLTIEPVTLSQEGAARGTGLLSQLPINRGNQAVMDSGRFYVTDLKIHLLGERRDWSHKLTEISKFDHDLRGWRLTVGTQVYSGENHADGVDAQLFVTVVKSLAARK